MKNRTITTIYLLLIILGIQSCKKKVDKNYFREAKNIINSRIDDYKKYELIFKSEIDDNLSEEEKIQISKNLIKLNMGWNKILIGKNRNLFQHSNIFIKNNSDVIFDRCFIDVFSSVEIDGEIYNGESSYKVNFNDNDLIELDIEHPLNNSFFLEKNRKLKHLNENDLNKKIKDYSYSIQIRAINSNEKMFLPLYSEDLTHMWENKHYSYWEYYRHR